jgi:hypothetical protein
MYTYIISICERKREKEREREKERDDRYINMKGERVGEGGRDTESEGVYLYYIILLI